MRERCSRVRSESRRLKIVAGDDDRDFETVPALRGLKRRGFLLQSNDEKVRVLMSSGPRGRAGHRLRRYRFRLAHQNADNNSCNSCI
jgi:hypothetical protein